jgi:hypothetical protein
MEAEVTGHIPDAAIQMRNGYTMLGRATSSALKTARTCLRKAGSKFQQLL